MIIPYFRVRKELKKRIKKELENVPENSLITYTINDNMINIKDYESEYSIKWTSLEYYHVIESYIMFFPFNLERPLITISLNDIEKEDIQRFKELLLSKLKKKK